MRKKACILMACVLAFAGCTHDSTKINEAGELVIGGETTAYRSVTFATIEVEGCQYLVATDRRTRFAVTHKGNCKYCLERRR